MSAEHLARAAATAVLTSHDEPDQSSIEQLVPLVYDELRALAHRQLMFERGELTVQTTELVHEAYLRLVDDTRVTRRGRSYFFAAAARAMRQVLVDAARKRLAEKRGGGAERVELDEHHVIAESYSAELLDLENALQRLGALSPRQARIVECRYFGGMSVSQTAAALDISTRTVEYDWTIGRAFLYDQLKGWEPDTSSPRSTEPPNAPDIS